MPAQSRLFVVIALAAAVLLLPAASPVAAAVNPGSDPAEMTLVGTRIFFAATTAAHGRELWVTDGTKAGTHEVADINSSPGVGSDPWQLTAMGQKVYFMADDGAGGSLWKSDGTPAGTKRLGAGGTSLLNVDGRLFYMAYPKLRTSDGTVAGTRAIATIDGLDDWGTFAGLNGNYYFFANDWGDADKPPQLWKSNGTASGTVKVKDIVAPGFDEPSDMVASGNRVFFRMGEQVACLFGCIGEGRLWQSNGTAKGTRQVSDVDAYPDLVDFDGTLYFGAWDASIEDDALFRTNGDNTGAHMVKRGLLPEYSTVVGPRLLFFTWRETGDELWRTKGTRRTTRLVYPVALPECGLFSNDPYCSLDETPVAVGSRLYFPAAGGAQGTELWVSDGTAAGTHLVKDIAPGSSRPSDLASDGTRLFFSARDGLHGRELWVSNGTRAGTHMVLDINPG